ncbi:hypothetical protein AHAS_Ahas15G0106500 [Arachis hypogaea]
MKQLSESAMHNLNAIELIIVQSPRLLLARCVTLGLPLPEVLLPYIKNVGFGHAVELRNFIFDNTLFSAYVERWRSETHTFHIECGKVTITVQDVAYHLGLHIDDLLGDRPPPHHKDRKHNFGLKMTWLNNRVAHIPPGADAATHRYVIGRNTIDIVRLDALRFDEERWRDLYMEIHGAASALSFVEFHHIDEVNQPHGNWTRTAWGIEEDGPKSPNTSRTSAYNSITCCSISLLFTSNIILMCLSASTQNILLVKPPLGSGDRNISNLLQFDCSHVDQDDILKRI